MDTDSRFVRINQRLADMNGLPVEAHLGRTVREVLPDWVDRAEQLLRPVLATGQPLLNVEISGETPAQPGVQRTWLESFWPLKEGNCVIGISTVCKEITDRKQAEQALQQSEAQIRAILAALPDLIVRVDADGIYRSVFASGGDAFITVGDTGTGIPPKVQERMVDPFFTTKPLGQGTGLGLAMVRGLVNA